MANKAYVRSYSIMHVSVLPSWSLDLGRHLYMYPAAGEGEQLFRAISEFRVAASPVSSASFRSHHC